MEIITIKQKKSAKRKRKKNNKTTIILCRLVAVLGFYAVIAAIFMVISLIIYYHKAILTALGSIADVTGKAFGSIPAAIAAFPIKYFALIFIGSLLAFCSIGFYLYIVSLAKKRNSTKRK